MEEAACTVLTVTVSDRERRELYRRSAKQLERVGDKRRLLTSIRKPVRGRAEPNQTRDWTLALVPAREGSVSRHHLQEVGLRTAQPSTIPCMKPWDPGLGTSKRCFCK